MNSWVVSLKGKPEIKDPVLIEGLPGIGNVGKVAIDFLIEHAKLKPIAVFTSHDLPHAVFVTERDQVELPCLSLYHMKAKKKDYLFLAGDVQPQSERSCYAFCEALLDLLIQWNCKEIITLGGIGLNQVSEKPKIYVAGNNRTAISNYKKQLGTKDKTYGVVGPIVGVTGLLLGVAKQKKIPAVALLSETYAHPMYVGVKEARQLLGHFNKMFGFKVPLDVLDKEIVYLEKEISKKTQDVQQLTEAQHPGHTDRVNYIG